jgi:hypothetical protein
MARSKRLETFPRGSKKAPDSWDVYGRQDGNHYAVLYAQNRGGFKFRLDHYPHRQSKDYSKVELALLAIEEEIF